MFVCYSARFRCYVPAFCPFERDTLTGRYDRPGRYDSVFGWLTPAVAIVAPLGTKAERLHALATEKADAMNAERGFDSSGAKKAEYVAACQQATEYVSDAARYGAE